MLSTALLIIFPSQVKILPESVLQINVVHCSRIPIVVFKDDAIHFCMEISDVFIPAKTVHILVFGFPSCWKLLRLNC